MQLVNFMPYVFAAILLFLSIRGFYCAIIFQRARRQARFAIDCGVWRGSAEARELMVMYLKSLSVNIDTMLDWRNWRVPTLIEDRWVPYWKHCSAVKPLVVSNEQMLYIKNRLEWAERAIYIGNKCTFNLKNGYDMGEDLKVFKDTVNKGFTGLKESEYCIIDIFTTNGMEWKHGPKQPESRHILPTQTSN